MAEVSAPPRPFLAGTRQSHAEPGRGGREFSQREEGSVEGRGSSRSGRGRGIQRFNKRETVSADC